MSEKVEAGSSPLELYLTLEERLSETRERHFGAESLEEDDILDDMDRLWWQLSLEQRRLIDEKPPATWPT